MRQSIPALLILVVAATTAPVASTQQSHADVSVYLPSPQTTGGKPLMEALAQRRTVRSFRDEPLPPQVLSNLLWAAFGVNRPRDVKPGLGRTAPSAMNKQEIHIYVVTAGGTYLYNAGSHSLLPIASGDLRSKMGSGDAAKAAVTLIYAADPKLDYAQVDTGFIGQNVYLFAASEGLNAWFYALHGQNDAASIARTLQLPPDVRPLYGQSVGYPPR